MCATASAERASSLVSPRLISVTTCHVISLLSPSSLIVHIVDHAKPRALKTDSGVCKRSNDVMNPSNFRGTQFAACQVTRPLLPYDSHRNAHGAHLLERHYLYRAHVKARWPTSCLMLLRVDRPRPAALKHQHRFIHERSPLHSSCPPVPLLGRSVSQCADKSACTAGFFSAEDTCTWSPFGGQFRSCCRT